MSPTFQLDREHSEVTQFLSGHGLVHRPRPLLAHEYAHRKQLHSAEIVDQSQLRMRDTTWWSHYPSYDPDAARRFDFDKLLADLNW